MGKLAFAVAEAKADPDEVIEFSLGADEFEVRRPTLDQVIALSLLPPEATEADVARASLAFMDGILLGDGAKRLRVLMARGVVSVQLLFSGDDNNETGIIPAIVEAATGNPTPSPTDSATSQTSGGKKSTGRAPGKGSTRSNSQPDDSSD